MRGLGRNLTYDLGAAKETRPPCPRCFLFENGHLPRQTQDKHEKKLKKLRSPVQQVQGHGRQGEQRNSDCDFARLLASVLSEECNLVGAKEQQTTAKKGSINK